jgi:hypothetical protein
MGQPPMIPLLHLFSNTAQIILEKTVKPEASKGFRRWYTTIEITGFLDFSHCPAI